LFGIANKLVLAASFNNQIEMDQRLIVIPLPFLSWVAYDIFLAGDDIMKHFFIRHFYTSAARFW
jgi:hypothetical protein